MHGSDGGGVANAKSKYPLDASDAYNDKQYIFAQSFRKKQEQSCKKCIIILMTYILVFLCYFCCPHANSKDFK